MWCPVCQLYIVLFLHQTTTPTAIYDLVVQLYIVLFLHQTTTRLQLMVFMACCISYYSYIKPQLASKTTRRNTGCISYYSYIKPQHVGNLTFRYLVVYRTIPTSNHNKITCFIVKHPLYIVLFLHQTTTYNVDIADNQHVTITFINKKWQSRK